jgi:hypothetical protein
MQISNEQMLESYAPEFCTSKFRIFKFKLMLKEGIDYYINEDGNFVFTKHYHLTRGYCCKNKCLHCPWDYGKPQTNSSKTDPEDKLQQS